ncbi:MATH domain and coiled-coil domain-containing protein At3g58360-like [Humulus lupulus]|uniref:MATH domain and coiled-coil domain-containing protein At3g58360-like n=1 Tax=Humulus lupulus TaxID=3486 RepID=UPI002B416A77|nr:MATH domain and coiled-coil domain-containing protein At3g58360-like [Humulus lupulus]
MEDQAKETSNEDVGQPTDIGRLSWTINNFSKLDSTELYSDIFYAGGCKWSLLIFPKGNNVDHLSMYLDFADSETLSPGWTKNVPFLSMSVINQNPKLTVKRETKHVFKADECDWGFASFISLSEFNDPSKGFLVRDVCTVEAEVRLNVEEQDIKKYGISDQNSTFVKGERSKSSFSEYDTLFVDIKKLLGGESFKSDNITSSICPPSWTVNEIAYAKEIIKQCLDIDLDKVIQLGRDFELKKSLSILLSSNAFPENMVDEINKFMANFVESCEQYEVAKQDLREVQEKEKSIEDLKTDMKQISSEFFPIRNQAGVVDNEIAELERQLIKRKAKKERLSKMLEVLAGRAATSKQALVSAERDHEKLSVLKKEEAEKVISDMKRSWEFLNLGYSNMLL